MFIVPAALHLLLNHSGLRHHRFQPAAISHGAAPILPELLRCQCIAMFGAGIHPALRHDRNHRHHSAPRPKITPWRATNGCALGRCPPGVELVIRGADGQPLPRAHRRIVCSSNNMLGYWNLPGSIIARTMDADGWIATGDVGYCDEGRPTSTIYDRTKGHDHFGRRNVHPAEVESAILRPPDDARGGR